MKTIAIYGKGGIGKSTIASNLSACIAAEGNRVLQVGCDPKHDSTQMLCGSVPTLLDVMMQKGAGITEADFLFEGCYGIRCVEIGGPQPGVGCAGRGIIKGIDTINRFEIVKRHSIDLCLFDVLGDVVCGGFFEPIRRGGADEVYIVTSGEFNSLFAANNICCGFVNSVPSSHKTAIGGIIGNLRGLPNEERIIETFAKKIGVPVLGIVPRDNRIERSTNQARPIIMDDASRDLAEIFQAMARKITTVSAEKGPITPYAFADLKKMQAELAGMWTGGEA